VDVRPVNHRVRIAEALAKALTRRDAGDQRPLERIVHHHLVGVNGPGARRLPNAQSVKGGKCIRTQLDARANLAELRSLFEHLDRESLTHQRERCSQAANTGTCNQDGEAGLGVHGACGRHLPTTGLS
jgi:hypothetical protein